MSDAYDQYAEQAASGGDEDLIDTEVILHTLEKAFNIVFPVIHSGEMPLAIHEREKINRAARFLCLKGGRLAKALRFACEHLDDEQLEQLQIILN